MGKLDVTHVAVLDVETSGVDPIRDRVLQYGLVLCSLPTFEIRMIRTCYVNPINNNWTWMRADPEALEVNGITKATITREGKTPIEALRFIFDGIANWDEVVLAGWGVDFDVGFARAEFERSGLKVPFKYRVFDVRSVCFMADLLAHSMSSGSVRYRGLAEWVKRAEEGVVGHLVDMEGLNAEMGKSGKGIHDAVYDALLTVKALRYLRVAYLSGFDRLGLPQDLDIVEGIRRGVKAYREGRMRPWSEVKRELEIS